MRTCQCGNVITCGCQDAVASDGTLVCKACVVRYNNKLLQQNIKPQNVDYTSVVMAKEENQSQAPIVGGITVKYNNFNP